MAAERRCFVIYDAGCRFCRRAAVLAESLADPGVQLLDAQDPEVARRFPQLSAARLAEALCCVTPPDEVAWGFDALAALARRRRPLRPIAGLLLWRPVAWFGRHLYRSVARRRCTARDRCAT